MKDYKRHSLLTYEPYLIQKYQPKYNNDLLEKFEFELPEIKL